MAPCVIFRMALFTIESFRHGSSLSKKALFNGKIRRNGTSKFRDFYGSRRKTIKVRFLNWLWPPSRTRQTPISTPPGFWPSSSSDTQEGLFYVVVGEKSRFHSLTRILGEQTAQAGENA